MRLHRFYINKPLGEELVVEKSALKSKNEINKLDELIHQWNFVFKFKEGDEILLFSGFKESLGSDYKYTFKFVSKNKVLLTCNDKRENIILNNKIRLYMSIVKKDTFETIVRQATELGVFEIIPVISERSEKKSLNMERLRSISIEATEQSFRGELPNICDIKKLSNVINEFKDIEKDINIYGSLNGFKIEDFKKHMLEKTSVISKTNEKQINLFVGPEGGWSKAEEDIFRDEKIFPLKLTETVLKADTAFVSLITLVSISIQDIDF